MTVIRTMTTAVHLTLLAMALAATGSSAFAQNVERIGDYEAWSAFKFEENGEPACYIASQPAKAEGNYTRRGEIFALVTHRPSEDRIGEVSIVTGYTYKADSVVEASIGDLTRKLFTKDDTAWAPDKETDKALVQAMIRGARMVVKGISTRGTVTTDTYSLQGFTAAYESINKACGA